ncbi:hypothetical protein EAI_03466 [Harpegnathos saltator]|uniref:Uncharacterized protein n=1 Tax=Harpegnathos saltator TaxID=610380 RepID=E2BXR0_HARSA|nr:hypothetical protein EAI_03466 [Harpegnathos saltator]
MSVNATQANYYIPVQHEDEDLDHLAWKQKCDECFKDPPYKIKRKNIPESCHATCILGRRYALTTMSQTYLKIGLNVQSRVPVVEIVFGDNRGPMELKSPRPLLFSRVSVREHVRAGDDNFEDENNTAIAEDDTSGLCLPEYFYLRGSLVFELEKFAMGFVTSN